MKTTVHGPLEFDVLAEGVGFPEGPVISEDGTVHVVDIDGGVIWRVDEGSPTVVARPGAGPTAWRPKRPPPSRSPTTAGFLWTEVRGTRIPIDHVSHTNEPPGFSGGWIERVDLEQGTVEVLHRDCDGRPLRGPNDLVFDEAGGLWFTDHGKGRRDSVDREGCTTSRPTVPR